MLRGLSGIRFAENQKLATDRIPVFHPRLRLPPPAMQVRRAVVEDAFNMERAFLRKRFEPRQ